MKTEQMADVCLLLEGTYPYVPGGVSAWVDQILRGLPHLKFALVYIGSKKGLTAKAFYKPPENVISLIEIYIYDRLERADLVPGKLPRSLSRRFYKMLHQFYSAERAEERVTRFLEVLNELDG